MHFPSFPGLSCFGFFPLSAREASTLYSPFLFFSNGRVAPVLSSRLRKEIFAVALLFWTADEREKRFFFFFFGFPLNGFENQITVVPTSSVPDLFSFFVFSTFKKLAVGQFFFSIRQLFSRDSSLFCQLQHAIKPIILPRLTLSFLFFPLPRPQP